MKKNDTTVDVEMKTVAHNKGDDNSQAVDIPNETSSDNGDVQLGSDTEADQVCNKMK